MFRLPLGIALAFLGMLSRLLSGSTIADGNVMGEEGEWEVGNMIESSACLTATAITTNRSEVQNKMIFMGHQILSCHVPVVRSFFINFKIISSSWNCWYDHLPKYFNITLKLPNMTFYKSKKMSCNELLSTLSASKSHLVLYHKSPCFD